MKGNKSAVTVVVVIVVLLIVVGAIFALAGNKKNDNKPAMNMNQSSQTNNSSNSQSSSSSPVATDSVTIQNFAFSPDNITVKVGSTVTWTNQDSTDHSVTSDDGVTGGPDSQLLTKGQSYSFTFSKAGTYTYHCKIHSDMTGTVVVTE